MYKFEVSQLVLFGSLLGRVAHRTTYTQVSNWEDRTLDRRVRCYFVETAFGNVRLDEVNVRSYRGVG